MKTLSLIVLAGSLALAATHSSNLSSFPLPTPAPAAATNSVFSVEADAHRSILSADGSPILDVPTPDAGQSVFAVEVGGTDAIAHVPIRQVAGDSRPTLAYVASHDAVLWRSSRL